MTPVQVPARVLGSPPGRARAPGVEVPSPRMAVEEEGVEGYVEVDAGLGV